MRATSVAQSARKKVEKATKEALEVARRELVCKGKHIKMKKAKVRKRMMKSYFQSTWGASSGQPLSLGLDGRMLDVPGVKSNSEPEYPNDGDLIH